MHINFLSAIHRGHSQHRWLNSHFYFSFAEYYDPQRIHFGKLRVINDDIIAPGQGFGMHPHANMEIITIPLSGALKHEDSMGNSSVIKTGEIQVMSAGSGIMHSEFNASETDPVSLFQIWIFPNQKDVTPRYEQQSLETLHKPGHFYQILSPYQSDEGVWIYQDAWMHLGEFKQQTSSVYTLKKRGNGVFLLIVEGEVKVEQFHAKSRDALEINNTEKITINSIQPSKILAIEVPVR